jgi:hypothetical protein
MQKRMLQFGEVRKAVNIAALTICNSGRDGEPCANCRMHTRDLIAEFLLAMEKNESAMDLRQRLVCEAADA